MTHTYLGNIETRFPKYKSHQNSSLKWLIEAHSYGKIEKEKHLNEKKINRFSCSADKIEFRYSELSDFLNSNWKNIETSDRMPECLNRKLADRMSLYKIATQNIFSDFYKNYNDNPPRHIIHVSCTGYASPSAAQKFVASKCWHDKTIVTHCYHMGCYASFPAIRIANGFLSASDINAHTEDKVDIVHTELCSLHFDLSSNTIDQYVVQSLFADGYAKYTLNTNKNFFKNYYFQLLSMHEQIIPQTEDAMTWDIGNSAFCMTISKSVPDIILLNIKEFLKKLIAQVNDKINIHECIFAIHPGGPKIISCVQEALSLTSDQISESIQILKECGNMSSATLPHVWKLILNNKPPKNTYVISVAFGPGLTISGSIMRVCINEFS